MQGRVRLPQQLGGVQQDVGGLQGLEGDDRQGQHHPGGRQGQLRQDDPPRGAGQELHRDEGQVGGGRQELQGIVCQVGRVGWHVDQADRRVRK